jgi:hypothetical protein
MDITYTFEASGPHGQRLNILVSTSRGLDRAEVVARGDLARGLWKLRLVKFECTKKVMLTIL